MRAPRWGWIVVGALLGCSGNAKIDPPGPPPELDDPSPLCSGFDDAVDWSECEVPDFRGPATQLCEWRRGTPGCEAEVVAYYGCITEETSECRVNGDVSTFDTANCEKALEDMGACFAACGPSWVCSETGACSCASDVPAAGQVCCTYPNCEGTTSPRCTKLCASCSSS